MEKQKYKIIADGASDLDPAYAQKNHVDIVPFYVSFDDATYQKELVEVGIRDFYQEMIDHPKVFPKSSMPSVQDYIDAFEPYAKNGIPILCICITAKFSGSYNCAMTAAGMMKDTYPCAEITVIDSTLNTVLEGMFVMEAVRMQRDGISYSENINKLLKMRSTGRILFTVGGMSYLVHGGRVGKLVGLAANTLNIRPLITMKEGEIFPSGLARSRKKSKDKVIDMICSHFREAEENAGHYLIHVGFGYDYEEAVSFRDQVWQAVAPDSSRLDTDRQMPPSEKEQIEAHPSASDRRMPFSDKEQIEIHQIGATVGVHTGPYPIGVGIIKKYEFID